MRNFVEGPRNKDPVTIDAIKRGLKQLMTDFETGITEMYPNFNQIVRTNMQLAATLFLIEKERKNLENQIDATNWEELQANETLYVETRKLVKIPDDLNEKNTREIQAFI